MDALRLLSRGTRTKKNRPGTATDVTVPSAQVSRSQLFASSASSNKRKRGQAAPLLSSTEPLSFFQGASRTVQQDGSANERSLDYSDEEVSKADQTRHEAKVSRPLVDRRALLKQHKIKVNVLECRTSKAKASSKGATQKSNKPPLYPDPVLTFSQLATFDSIPGWLLDCLSGSGFTTTTEVQMVTLDLQLSNVVQNEESTSRAIDSNESDLLTVAPTGSGKTLAFLIPTLARIASWRSQHKDQGRHTAALILAPTKELVDQIVNDGRQLSENSGIRISQFRKGMLLSMQSTLDSVAVSMDSGAGTIVKSDILVSTPGVLYNSFQTLNDSATFLQQVRHLILDEADVLLDPLFREQTVSIWQKLLHPKLSVSLWSATMGSNIEELAQSIIRERLKAMNRSNGSKAAKRPLIRVIVGLKDSAVPNVEHKLIYAATEQGKLMGLRQLLHPTTFSTDSGPALRPPFIIFTQTIERAIALHKELLYDIPAEAGGITRIAVLHSDLSDTAREAVMTRFRKGEVWVMITTDLLSRGIDFRGVNGVVNYDIPSSSAAYVHRVGRTGRAGRQGGVAITLYSKEDIPYLKHVANVVAAAQRENGVDDGRGVQKWLLGALPTLSKNEKQRFKKRGVEARTARGMEKDAKAARRARISTKAGYDRKLENRKRQAIDASKRRTKKVSEVDHTHDNNFDGFE